MRRVVEQLLPPGVLATALVADSIAPYLIYSVPTGCFSWTSLLKLSLICACIAFPYVLCPVRKHKLCWQDALVIGALAYPMISGLNSFFADIYVGFEPPAHRLESLGKLMLIPLGIFTFLSLRKLHGVGLHLLPDSKDWRPALLNLLVATPFLVLVILLTGYLRWQPPVEHFWVSLGGTLGKLLGIYFTTALAEEFLLRAVVQNLTASSLGKPLVARFLAALLFGAAHLGRGSFPNLPYASNAFVLGWFCGRAYEKTGSITTAMITHALAVAVQMLFFS